MEGVVTFASPDVGCFVQDDTAGVYLSPKVTGVFAEKDRVRVEGVTNEGTFAPCIYDAVVTVIGAGELPEPVLHNLDPDDNRWLDGRRIEARVFVQSRFFKSQGIYLNITSLKGVGTIRLHDTPENRLFAANIVNCVIRVRGVNTSPEHDPETRMAYDRARILVSSVSEIVKLSEIGTDSPDVPISNVKRGFLTSPAPLGWPIALSGIVTLEQDLDEETVIVVQDGTDAAFVRLAHQFNKEPGAYVRVVGYLDIGAPGTQIINAHLHEPRGSPPEVKAQETTASKILSKDLWGRLVSIEGVVESRARRGDGYLIDCRDGPSHFTIIVENHDDEDPTLELEAGSRVVARGVPFPMIASFEGSHSGMAFHIQDINDIRVLSVPPLPLEPSWWTVDRVRRLIIGLALLGISIGIWTISLGRQVRKQTTQIREGYEKQRALESSLQEARRLEAIARLVSGISHDFNNLLTVIIGAAEMASDNLDDSHPASTWIESLRGAAQQAAGLTRQLLTYSRRNATPMQIVDLAAIVDENRRLVESSVGNRIEVQMKCDGAPLPIRGDPTLLSQVILNLSLNARDAMPEGGRLAFTLRADKVAEVSVARLLVSDTGCGMDGATSSRIFEPFFTTKEQGKGTGLGLSIVYGVVRDLGGSISVDSTPGMGTTFDVTFPLTIDSRATATSDAASPSVGSDRQRILLVDDEKHVRDVCRMALLREGFGVIDVASGEDALRVIREEESPFQLLITDVSMPAMRGDELALAIRADYPEMKILFISGRSSDESPMLAEAAESGQFLQKPFRPTELAERVKVLLAD